MVTAGWLGDLAGVEVDTDNGSLSFEYILGKIFIPLVRANSVSRNFISTYKISHPSRKFDTLVQKSTSGYPYTCKTSYDT
jgi:hypothetical protein